MIWFVLKESSLMNDMIRTKGIIFNDWYDSYKKNHLWRMICFVLNESSLKNDMIRTKGIIFNEWYDSH